MGYCYNMGMTREHNGWTAKLVGVIFAIVFTTLLAWQQWAIARNSTAIEEWPPDWFERKMARIEENQEKMLYKLHAIEVWQAVQDQRQAEK